MRQNFKNKNFGIMKIANPHFIKHFYINISNSDTFE